MAMSGAEAMNRFQRLGQQPWLATLQRRGPGLAALALALIVAWQLAGLILSLLPGREDANIAPPVALTQAGSGGAPSASATDVAPIVAAHLFGEARPEDDVAVSIPQDDPDAPETDLPLELRGTLASDSEDNALAIIADGRQERVYGLGDTIRSGVTLHAVQREQVLLNRGGALESLKLPRPEEVEGTPAPTRRARPSIRRAAGQPSMSQVLTQNAAQFTQIISPRPYYVGGQQRGYRLYPGSDRQSFAKLGLRPGDIVTAINGTPLNNPSQGARIFSELGNAQSITVTLERGGQEQSLTLDTSSLDFSDQATQ